MKAQYLLILLILATANPVLAQEPKAPEGAPDAEQVNVDMIKEKYWAKGKKAQLGVVQNRLYSKAGKFQLGTFAGVIQADPFLNIKVLGLSAGYHLSEFWGLNLIYWKNYVSGSSALEKFEQTRNATANTNPPYYFIGGEATFSAIYGKLSFIGQKIIYYDLHLSGGAGMVATESGKYMAPAVGIGQRFYLNQHLSIRLDYRLQYYNEEIKEKEIPTKLGQVVGERGNYNNIITLGVDFLF